MEVIKMIIKKAGNNLAKDTTQAHRSHNVDNLCMN